VLAALALVALGSGLLASCSNNKGDSVAVLGDSITTLDETDIRTQLGEEFSFTISGNFGKTVAEVLPEAEVVATRSHDQLIINLGTNDVLQGLPVADSMKSLEQMIAMYDSSRCVFLVNINEHMIDQRTGKSVSDQAKQFNRSLADLAKTDGRISIIDWNSTAETQLNDANPPYSDLTSDSIHPTQEGDRLLNELYRQSLEGCGQLI
jgi:lysophospholipase L1-like esterase